MTGDGRPVRLTLQEGLCLEERPEPCGMVVFGASGDLARRKLLPSLARLDRRGLLPKGFFTVGFSRSELSDAAFRARASGLAQTSYLAGDYDQPASYQELARRLKALHDARGTRGNVLFYLAVPPALGEAIPRRLQEAGLLHGTGGWSRLVVEKPFGSDLASARRLGQSLDRCLDESQIFRIDHYLGKDTVQNILVLRFANSIFEPVWDRGHVDHVQISVLESLGVEDRAGYYDEAGVVRDMFQNHMLQLLALTAMEAPAESARCAADAVHDMKVQVLRSLKPLELSDVCLGQYEGYASEPGVRPGSRTPTFGAARVEVDSWRWSGVPFYLRTGKRLGKRAAEIAVVFKDIPRSVFPPLGPRDFAPNVLALRIQPDEGVSLRFSAKKPGPRSCVGTLTMDFDYDEVFGAEPPEAYERLLLDCMLGDQTLFIRCDAVEETWRFVDPLLKASDMPLHPYRSGSWGPAASDELLARGGRTWRNP